MQTSLEWQQCLRCLRTEENLRRGTRKLFWVINIFAIFTVVMVSQVYTYVGTCQIVHCTYVEFTLAIKPREALKAASQVVLVAKNPPSVEETYESRVQSLGREDPLEEGLATHSSIFAWRIPWTEEPGGLQSIALQSQTWLKWLSMDAWSF